MARSFGQIRVDIWRNEGFLDLSTDAQRLYLYLATQSKLSFAGVLSWRPRFAARAARNLTVKMVEEAAGELEAHAFIVLDDQTDELLVRSFIRHDDLMKSPNLAKAMLSDWNAIDSDGLRAVVAHEVQRLAEETPELKGLSYVTDILEAPSRNPSETLPGTLPVGDAEQTQTQTHSTDTHTARSAQAAIAAEFAIWYSEYPKKTGKPDALKAFTKARKTVSLETLTTGLAKYKHSVKGTDRQYIANPASWINSGRWEDDYGNQPTDGPTVPNQYRMFN